MGRGEPQCRGRGAAEGGAVGGEGRRPLCRWCGVGEKRVLCTRTRWRSKPLSRVWERPQVKESWE